MSEDTQNDQRVDRPNILLIMADQWGAADVGCYGSPVGSTPTLDSLASMGMRFDRCYATHPVCGPNRATMLTGRSSCTHGVTVNNLQLYPDMPTYPLVLQNAGYRTGGFGKFHVTPMALPHPPGLDYLGFDESVIVEDPRLGPWLDWIEAEHPDHYDRALSTCWPMPYLADYGPDHLDLMPRWREAVAKHMTPRRNASPWQMVYESPLPAELQPTTYITDRAIDFVQRAAQADDPQPFFCKVSYVAPHDPYDPSPTYASRFQISDMPAPVGDITTGQDCRAYRVLREWQNFGEVWSPELCQQARAAFHGSVAHIDDQISRLIHNLKQAGQWERTVVVFTTDHGDCLGDHGLPTKSVTPYDRAVRCPLIVAGAGIASGRSDALRCTLDFFPTLLDLAGVEHDERPPVEGRPFTDVLAGRKERDPWQQVAVSVGSLTHDGTSMRSVFTDDGWRLTRFPGESYAEMIHLREDRDELHNRYDQPADLPKRAELLERMAEAFSGPDRCPAYRAFPTLPDGRRGRIADTFALEPAGYQSPRVSKAHP